LDAIDLHALGSRADLAIPSSPDLNEGQSSAFAQPTAIGDGAFGDDLFILDRTQS
jgi:hypothetical protein